MGDRLAMLGSGSLAPPLVDALAVSTYAAFLTLLGFLGRSIMQARRRETATEARVRRRIRKLRAAVAQLRIDVRRGADAERKVQALAEDVAVLASEVEALRAWQAASQVRRAGDGDRPTTPPGR